MRQFLRSEFGEWIIERIRVLVEYSFGIIDDIVV